MTASVACAFDRRSVIRSAAGSLLALSVPALWRTGAIARTSAAFAPPATPMVYSRQLLRIMAGGARFLVARSFTVRFTPDGGGYLLAGTQSGVTVEAPPALARFAELEKARVETGLFPLRLDRAGQIQADFPEAGAAAPSSGNASLTAAVAAAQAMAAQGGGSAETQAQRVAFINAIHQSASQLITELPADLFAPRRLDHTERQDLELPGNLMGRVTARFVAGIDPATGLMRSASRTVTTVIGTDQRETIESWTLNPA